jgi:hypothetical protein
MSKKRYGSHRRKCVPSSQQPSMVHYARSKGASEKTKELQQKKAGKKELEN